MLGEVQRLLGQYAGIVASVENAPRPSDYLRAYRQVGQRSEAVSKSLRELSPQLREQLDAWLMDTLASDIDNTERVLDALGRALIELQKQIGANERGSAGRPRNSGLQMTVGGLRGVFQKYYCGPRGPVRQRRGAIKAVSEEALRERHFVTIALRSAKIPTTGLAKLLA